MSSVRKYRFAAFNMKSFCQKMVILCKLQQSSAIILLIKGQGVLRIKKPFSVLFLQDPNFGFTLHDLGQKF